MTENAMEISGANYWMGITIDGLRTFQISGSCEFKSFDRQL